MMAIMCTCGRLKHSNHTALFLSKVPVYFNAKHHLQQPSAFRSSSNVKQLSWLLLDVTLTVAHFQDLAQTRKREVMAREVYGDQPGSDHVDKVMQEVRIGDTVNSSVDCKDEEKNVRDVSEAVGLS